MSSEWLLLSRNNVIMRGYFISYTRFFWKATLVSTQLQCCLTFSWVELQMLLRCCLIHKSIITLKHFLYLLYLRPCLDLGLFLLYLCDLIFIFILIFVMINRMNTDTLVLLLIFQNMSYYLWMITWMKNVHNFWVGKVQPQCVV